MRGSEPCDPGSNPGRAIDPIRDDLKVSIPKGHENLFEDPGGAIDSNLPDSRPHFIQPGLSLTSQTNSGRAILKRSLRNLFILIVL